MLYFIARAIFIPIFFLLFRVSAQGAENIPKEGGAIICSNHLSFFDPIAIGIKAKRQIHFVGKKELFKNKLVAWCFKEVGAFSIDRDNPDMQSFKTAMKFLKEGEILGIFAQGTRMKEVDAKGAKSGVTFFALKANVPIIPVGICGNYKLFSKMTVKFGEPIYFDEYKDVKVKTELLNEITENVMNRVSELVKNWNPF